MAKVFKATMYITDANGDIHDLEYELERMAQRLGVSIHIAEMNESEEFEWHDELRINYVDVTTEELEEYFEEEE